MITVEQSTGKIVVSSPNLRLTFEHTGDRWRHWLSVDAGIWRELLVSQEGTSADASPPSPVFQDLRLETIDEAKQEFQLFGQSGKNIYSAAVRFDGKTETIDFDLCLRTRDADPIAARVTYSVQHETESLSISTEDGTIGTADSIARTLILHAAPPPSIVPASKSYSLRWRYRISFNPEPAATAVVN